MQENSAPDGLAAILDASKPYLGSLVVVDGLVRKFAGDVLAIRKRQNADEINEFEARDAVIRLAQDVGAIFMGKNADYTPMKWNSDRRLGILLRTHYADADQFDSPGTSAFVWFANQVLAAAVDGERGRPERELQAEMTEVINYFERILLGAHLPDGVADK